MTKILFLPETVDGEPAKTPYIIGRIVDEPAVARNLFDKGQLDTFFDIPSNDVGQLKSLQEYTEQALMGLYFYAFNVKKPPLDNLKVRKAIAMAINKGHITKILNSGEQVLNAWVPAGMIGHSESLGLGTNIKKANQLLDEAGYKDRSQFPKIQLAYNSNDRHQRIAEIVQSQLKKNLGIQLELLNQEWKVYINGLKAKPPHIYRLGWVAALPDPDNILGFMRTDSGNNYTGWDNKNFDRLLDKGMSTPHVQKREEQYVKAQKLLLESDVTALPLFRSADRFMVNRRVKNFPLNPMSRMNFKNLELKNH